MTDRIAPPAARRPGEVLELLSAAVSDGDLDAALAQYEPGAMLRLWARPTAENGASTRSSLIQLMELRLPVSVDVCTMLHSGELALILGSRQIAGTGPDRERVQLSGIGATIVRRQLGGSWRIAIDCWQLSEPFTGADPAG
jgi:ketosteroid isomerase-like protein